MPLRIKEFDVTENISSFKVAPAFSVLIVIAIKVELVMVEKEMIRTILPFINAKW